MTRFARAKGSKSSNERAPEDSTPWEVMKDQLLQAKKDNDESKKRQEAEKQRIENYENFLKDLKVQKRKATWCDFPEYEAKKTKVKPTEQTPKKINKHKNNTIQDPDRSNSGEQEIKTSSLKNKKKKQKKSRDDNKNEQLDNSNKVEAEHSQDQGFNESDKLKGKNKKKSLKYDSGHNKDADINVSEDNTDAQHHSKLSKNKKQNVPSGVKTLHDNKSNNNDIKGSNQNNNNSQVKKIKKHLKGAPTRRKPINDNSFQLIINGKEVELVRFDGFPIMKKDAERLDELRKNMIQKGIPKSEVQRTLKLERRRAEKALARLKRDVCYNCRKGGHNLSDCPELKSKIPGVGVADGVCFKCGSTEHRQFECKVQKDKEFRFATCFICKEPGHIARQCPDNPKGLYPNGGSCKLCGDVTHLRKDCPTVNEQKEETSIKLHTLDYSENIEDIQQKQQHTSVAQEKTKLPKKVKF